MAAQLEYCTQPALTGTPPASDWQLGTAIGWLASEHWLLAVYWMMSEAPLSSPARWLSLRPWMTRVGIGVHDGLLKRDEATGTTPAKRLSSVLSSPSICAMNCAPEL